ncbi:MAG: hypothetical protein MUF72_21555 [Elainella sp. Prado103]|jgi:hypothetical protein|nr:hypothetical protein [Elainella sp. Prado103]
MFILKRQDVEISSIQHPQKDQQVPILQYQGQTFRLISVFNAAQEEEARAFWRDLTDNRGKACVLLEEPERYSVWGKVRLEQLQPEPLQSHPGEDIVPCMQACLLLLQAVYLDIEDLLGNRQVASFRRELQTTLQQNRFPDHEVTSLDQLLHIDPLGSAQWPAWRERHLNLLLLELYRLGKQHFGNTNFVERAMDALQDLPLKERGTFLNWLKKTAAGQLWQSTHH